LGHSDTIENIGKLKTELETDIPCENILGLVIYDLPGRDCAAKASNGELKVGEVSKYKSEYIDGKSFDHLNKIKAHVDFSHRRNPQGSPQPSLRPYYRA